MNILIWGVYIASMVLFVRVSLYLCKKIMTKFKINRWIIAFLAPLILIIPGIFCKNITTVTWSILIAIFMALYILFFEINREISETKGIKATMDIRKAR